MVILDHASGAMVLHNTLCWAPSLATVFASPTRPILAVRGREKGEGGAKKWVKGKVEQGWQGRRGRPEKGKMEEKIEGASATITKTVHNVYGSCAVKWNQQSTYSTATGTAPRHINYKQVNQSPKFDTHTVPDE